MQVIIKGNLSGQYKVVGQDLWDTFGYMVESGSDNLLQLPASKEVYVFDWKGQHGKQYDLTRRFFEDKTVTLSGYLMAPTKAEFWQKYLAFWEMWKSPGPKTLYSAELEQTFSVFYQKSSNAKRLTKLKGYPDRIVMKLDLELQVMFSEFVSPGVEQLPPVVNSGGNKELTLPLQEIILTGASANGRNGAIVTSTRWEFTSSIPAGLTVGISNANTLTPRITSLSTAGAYNFKFTATDTNGLSASSDMRLTVKPAPAIPPTVRAGGNKTIVLPVKELDITGASVTANGGASITSVLWTYEYSVPEGLPATITLANTLVPKVINLENPGIYSLKLVGIDNNASRAEDTMKITVLPAVVSGNSYVADDYVVEDYVI